MRNLRLTTPALVFLLLGVEASAQGDCGQVCTAEFWESATPDEIEAALNVVSVTARDAQGYTALHRAARMGATENIVALLDAGADVHARTALGWTPVHSAALSDNQNIILLLEVGAEVNARDILGAVPLHYAAAGGTVEGMLSLLEAGAEVNVQSNYGMTPLHIAAMAGTPALIMTLLNAGADATLTNTDEKTPFDLAKDNEELRGGEAYWALNDARFK